MIEMPPQIRRVLLAVVVLLATFAGPGVRFALATPMFDITASAVHGSIVPPGAAVGYSGNITFQMWADPGCHAVDVLVNGASVGPVGSYTFINVFSDQSIVAIFDYDACALTYVAGPGGSIAGATSQTVPHGGTGTCVTAVAAPGYHFTGWSDGLATAVRTDADVTQSASVTAVFGADPGAPATSISGVAPTWVRTPPIFSVVATGDAPPFLSYYTLNGSGPVLYTGPAPVLAQGSTMIAYWSVDSRGWVEAPKSALVSLDTVPPLTALFGASDGSTCTAPVALGLAATDGAGSGVGVTWYRIDGGAEMVWAGDPFTLSAAGRHSVEWWSADVVGNIETPHRIGLTVTRRTHTVTYLAGEHGSISGPGRQVVDDGADALPVTAVPHAGCRFVRWSDGVATPRRADVAVTADRMATAFFEPNTYEIVPLAGAGGTILPSGTQTVEYGGTAAFDVAASPGYSIADVLVDGASIGPVVSYRFGAVAAAHTIEARFMPLAPVRTSVTIAADRSTSSAGRTVTLAGRVTPTSAVGGIVAVQVRKPGTARWSYSSNRRVYASGGAAWQYRYVFKAGMGAGTYAFRAQLAPATGYLGSTSGIASVRVR